MGTKLIVNRLGIRKTDVSRPQLQAKLRRREQKQDQYKICLIQ